MSPLGPVPVPEKTLRNSLPLNLSMNRIPPGPVTKKYACFDVHEWEGRVLFPGWRPLPDERHGKPGKLEG